MKNCELTVLFNEEQIESCLNKMAQEINDYFADSESLIVVGLLKGAWVFMADLVRKLEGNIQMEGMTVSSYGNEMTSSRQLKIVQDLLVDIKGHDVLLVDDIIDTGNTLAKVKDLLLEREPNRLAIAALLDKPERRETEVDVTFTGLTIPDVFIVGYGIDYAQQFRQLPYLAKVQVIS